eukprot:scaffold52583_cov58-Phaeocystis_antarctica.AAC.1
MWASVCHTGPQPRASRQGPGLADRVPGRSATHMLEPHLGQFGKPAASRAGPLRCRTGRLPGCTGGGRMPSPSSDTLR